MFYGYRCYDKDGKALGWLYTYHSGTEITWTIVDLNWCKRWKTERGAQKHFENYNGRWQFQSKGGYLKIEVMPKMEKLESTEFHRQKLMEEWGDKIVKPLKADEVAKSAGENPLGHELCAVTMSFQPKPEILKWLDEQRWMYDNGEPEPDTVLLNRKLEKLMKLEQQGF